MGILLLEHTRCSILSSRRYIKDFFLPLFSVISLDLALLSLSSIGILRLYMFEEKDSQSVHRQISESAQTDLRVILFLIHNRVFAVLKLFISYFLDRTYPNLILGHHALPATGSFPLLLIPMLIESVRSPFGVPQEACCKDSSGFFQFWII